MVNVFRVFKNFRSENHEKTGNSLTDAPGGTTVVLPGASVDDSASNYVAFSLTKFEILLMRNKFAIHRQMLQEEQLLFLLENLSMTLPRIMSLSH